MLLTEAKPIKLISIDDYLAGELQSPIKHEYLGGYIHAMAGGTNAHNEVSLAFSGLMFNALRGKQCRPFNSDTKVRIQSSTQTRFYYPDGMVVCQPNGAADTFQDRPVIIVEVLSHSTRKVDEREKLDAYLKIPSLSNYLLIESTQARVVVHRRTPNGFVAEQYDGLNSVVPLDVIDSKLSLAELYERVDFTAAQAADVDPVDATG